MPPHQTRLLANRYELVTPIGRGTMGTVWRAHDRSLGREVAVKEIRQEPGLSEAQRAELRERMLREGRTAARINHPSVATVYDAIEDGGRPWIIMELVEARSLEQVVDEEGPLPSRLVAEIGSDLLGALRAAHALGILHRDVKPGNVLLTETGRVVLTDFGIAKSEGDANLTRTGMVIGSPGYTAPERARGEHTGPESDLWSLGATLYFAVEGRPAYERASVSATLAALMTENADPPTQAGLLRPVLEALLEKDHRVRLSPAKAAGMLRAVADTPATGDDGVTRAVRPNPRPGPGAGPDRRGPQDARPAPQPPQAPPAPSAPSVPAGGRPGDPERTVMVSRPSEPPRRPSEPPRRPSGGPPPSPQGRPTAFPPPPGIPEGRPVGAFGGPMPGPGGDTAHGSEEPPRPGAFGGPMPGGADRPEQPRDSGPAQGRRPDQRQNPQPGPQQRPQQNVFGGPVSPGGRQEGQGYGTGPSAPGGRQEGPGYGPTAPGGRQEGQPPHGQGAGPGMPGGGRQEGQHPQGGYGAGPTAAYPGRQGPMGGPPPGAVPYPQGGPGHPLTGPPANSYPGIPVAGVPGSGMPFPARPGGDDTQEADRPLGPGGSHGLGTDLFAIAGPARPDPGEGRNTKRLFFLILGGLLAIAVIIIVIASAFIA